MKSMSPTKQLCAWKRNRRSCPKAALGLAGGRLRLRPSQHQTDQIGRPGRSWRAWPRFATFPTLVAAVLPAHAEDDGQGVGSDSITQAAVQERQRRQEIEALQAIARELRGANAQRACA